MTPKVVYTLNSAEKTITFELDEFTTFTPKWTRDEVEYKNPFTGDKNWKKRGYYFTATIHFEGLPYATLEDYRDIVNKHVVDLKFYPDSQTIEQFEVDSNEEFEYEDKDVALAVLNFDLVFRGKKRFETPLCYSYEYWGDRRHTFIDIGDQTFDHYTGP